LAARIRFGWAAAAGFAVVFAWLLAATPSSQQGQRQAPAAAAQSDSGNLLHDSYLHLANYLQEGPDLHDFPALMGTSSPWNEQRHADVNTDKEQGV
jgi:hypothetical protein